jgi:hypothetical protein
MAARVALAELECNPVCGFVADMVARVRDEVKHSDGMGNAAVTPVSNPPLPAPDAAG